MKKKGFTLLELMIVIGIIATLMAVLLKGFGGSNAAAERAKVQELVSNTATALGVILQNGGSWPKVLITKNGKQIEEDVAAVFVRHNLLGLTYDKSKLSNNDKVVLLGSDRCGLADHWGQNALKKSKNTSGTGDKAKKVGRGAGGTVRDHLLWYAVDEDGDGITEINADGIGSLRVRASACVWSAGKNGVVEPWQDVGRSDDVYSWNIGQVVH